MRGLMVHVQEYIFHHFTKVILALAVLSMLWVFPGILLLIFIFQIILDQVHWTFYELSPLTNGLILMAIGSIVGQYIWIVYISPEKISIEKINNSIMYEYLHKTAFGVILAMKKGRFRILGIPLYICVIGMMEAFYKHRKSIHFQENFWFSIARFAGEISLVMITCGVFGIISFLNSPGNESVELREAVRNSDYCKVRDLLSRGYDPNIGDSYDTTPLHICAQQAIPRIAKILIKYGANPNLQDAVGFTPLHWGVQIRNEETSQDNRLELIRILLEHGANPKIEDLKGISAMSIASKKGNAAVLSLLNNAVSFNTR